MNAQKHLVTTETSLKTLFVFLKISNLLEAETTAVLTCFSNINFQSRMTDKIFNSKTISTAVPSMTKSENKDTAVREQEMIVYFVLFGFTSIPHLLYHALIIAKSAFKDAATDALSRE